MAKHNATKRALLASALALLLCVSMLIGTTYAWFTASVTSGENKIVAGKLDVELSHLVNGEYEPVGEDALLFDVELWEPGVVAYETFKVSNEGDLALKYLLSTVITNSNSVVTAEGEVTDLTLLDVLTLAIVEGEIDPADRDAALAAAEFVNIASFSGKTGNLLPKDAEAKEGFEDWSDVDTFTVLLYWEPTENDNDYNLSNGAYASDAAAGEVGALSIDVTVSLVATQVPYEADSFDETYDEDAYFPRLTTGPALKSALNDTIKAAGVDSYHRVKTVTFADYDEAYGAWEDGVHVGATQADDIRMFALPNAEDEKFLDLYFCVQPGMTIMLNEDSHDLFWNFVLLESIDFGPKGLVSTQNVKNMNRMFGSCAISEIDLSGWDVSNVTTMGTMFNDNKNLTSIDLSGWDVSNVTSFTQMFQACINLKEIDLSTWNVSGAVVVGRMFNGCSSLETIYSNDWDIARPDTEMFLGCENLPGFDASKTTAEYAKTTANGGYFTAK